MSPELYGEGEIPLLRLVPLVSRIIGISDKAKKYDITKSQLMFMTALYYRGLLSMTKISEFISSSKEQATRAVAPLVDRGIVKRVEIPENRTRVYIELTEDGKQIMDSLRDECHHDVNERLKACLSDEEFSTLLDSVRTVISLLNKVD